MIRFIFKNENCQHCEAEAGGHETKDEDLVRS